MRRGHPRPLDEIDADRLAEPAGDLAYTELLSARDCELLSLGENVVRSTLGSRVGTVDGKLHRRLNVCLTRAETSLTVVHADE